MEENKVPAIVGSKRRNGMAMKLKNWRLGKFSFNNVDRREECVGPAIFLSKFVQLHEKCVVMYPKKEEEKKCVVIAAAYIHRRCKYLFPLNQLYCPTSSFCGSN